MAKEWRGIINEPEYSEEEDRIYNQSITAIRVAMEAGRNFDEACEGLEVEDRELKRFIVDDFLKITIAEEHFNKGASLEDVARKLGISLKRVERARDEMLKEVQQASVEVYKAEQEASASKEGMDDEGLGGPKGNA